MQLTFFFVIDALDKVNYGVCPRQAFSAQSNIFARQTTHWVGLGNVFSYSYLKGTNTPAYLDAPIKACLHCNENPVKVVGFKEYKKKNQAFLKPANLLLYFHSETWLKEEEVFEVH